MQGNTARSRIFREYLCENELLSKTILACLSGSQLALIHEIKNANKSRDTAPLRGTPPPLNVSNSRLIFCHVTRSNIFKCHGTTSCVICLP